MKTLTEVIAQFPLEILEQYDFSKAAYNGALKPMTGIVCAMHGEFQQYAAQFRKNGAGCPTCGAEQRVLSNRLSPEEFLRRAEAAHPLKYTYEKTHYVNATTKVTVSCKKHGDFQINPYKLTWNKQGCPACGDLSRGHQNDKVACRVNSAKSKKKKFKELFTGRAQAVHGEKYDYSNHNYITGKHKVTIGCPTHGIFKQAVYHHLSGQGCPKCGNTKSKEEDAVVSYLSMFGVVQQRDRELIKPKELDIYLPDKQLAIEYSGMYWHSHGSSEEESKNKRNHFYKYQACKEKGIRLLTIYESEWKERKPAIKRLLRNAIGKSKGKVMARKCELRKVSNPDARAFYEKYHPQGGTGHGEHYALFWKGKMVACMRFVYGANDRGASAQNRTWTLGRYATRITVTGGASRLFKAFLTEQNPSEVKSFSDNRYFEGGMYAQLGFELEEELGPDYQVWSPKLGLLPKPHYQRRNLPQRITEHGKDIFFDPKTDPRTEADITYLIGARRIFDCGKKRWVYKSSCL